MPDANANANTKVDATATANEPRAPRRLGRYQIIGTLARGGMGTVYLGRHAGGAGFQRLNAIKVMHAHLAHDASFVEMLLDEARLAARLHHPNVVPIVDLGSQDGLHYVVMDYVEGCAMSVLLKKHRDDRPPRMLIPMVLDALSGLHAAHTLTDDDGKPLKLVHRDVSPHNVLVGVDGTARITDFGIAKAESQIHSTRPGQMKGKLAYMSPEHFQGATKLDCRSDVFSAGAMLWSALTGRRLFLGGSDAETLHNVLHAEVVPPSRVGHCPPAALDAVCLRALERDPDKRFASALEMEEALREAAIACNMLGSKREVAEWVVASLNTELAERRAAIRAATTALSERRQAGPSTSGTHSLPSLVQFTSTDGINAGSTTGSVTSSVEGANADRSDARIDGAAQAAMRRRLAMMMAASVAAFVIAGIVAALALRSSSVPTAAAMPTQAEAPTAAHETAPAVTEGPGAPTAIVTHAPETRATSDRAPTVAPRRWPPPPVAAKPADAVSAAPAPPAPPPPRISEKPRREIDKENPYGP